MGCRESSRRGCPGPRRGDAGGDGVRARGSLEDGAPGSVTALASRPATLSAVSCPSATQCVAVGSYLDSSGNPDAGPLVEVSNGSGWTVPSTPKVPGGGLMGISCPSASACVAVGTIDKLVGSDRTGGDTVSLIETYG